MAAKEQRQAQWMTWLAPACAFAACFGVTTYILTPQAPAKTLTQPQSTKRTTDQHYAGCDQARANGHENIAAWEPSYRESMDGDGDGLACEPYR